MNDNLPKWLAKEIKRLYLVHPTWQEVKLALRKIAPDYRVTMQQAYDVIHDITPEDRIAPCGKEKKISSFTYGYQFCGRHCTCSKDQRVKSIAKTSAERYGGHHLSNKTVRNKIQATNLERYGGEPLANSTIREKSVATIQDRYGVDHPMRSQDVRAKVTSSMVERYGVEHALQSPDIRQNQVATMQERYGVDNASKIPEAKRKTIATNIERYGVPNPSMNPTILDKIRITNEARFGVSCSLSATEVSEKIRQTNLDRYGTVYPSQAGEVKAKRKSTNRERYGVDFSCQFSIKDALATLNDKTVLQQAVSNETVSAVAKRLGVHPTTVYNYWHGHGLDLEILGNKSTHEIDLRDWLTENEIDFVWNDRQVLRGKEIDFFLPSCRLAIEINGLYWHSDKFKPNDYHRRKLEACRNARIDLLMINEDEWLERADSVKSRILHLAGRSPKGLAARKLRLEEIGSTEANQFLARHHIQGPTSSIIYAVAAFEDGAIAGVMTFGKQRGTGHIELTRFCTDEKSRAGLFSRLFRRSITRNGFDEIISFADLRYSNGNVYGVNGFSLVGEIAPDYRYVKGVRSFHKSLFTKKRISDKFNIDLTNLTEREAMTALGFYRIYDCGKLKFIWRDK